MNRIIAIITLCLVACCTQAQLRLNSSNELLLNHTGEPIGSSSFTLSQQTSSFGGMYVNTTGTSGVLKPFYGFAINGGIRSFLYHDQNTNSVGLNVSSQDNFRAYIDSTTFFKTLVAKEEFRLDKSLTVGSFLDPKFQIQEDGRILMNSRSHINSLTDFTLNSTLQNSFGGMYINVDGTLGEPFYGYAIDGRDKAWTSYDNADNFWQVAIVQNESVNEIIRANFTQVELNGDLLVNTDSPFNSFTDFTINSKTQSSFGGMFINVDGASGEPFYGYAVNGTDRAWTSYDETDDTWNLAIVNPTATGLKEIIQVDYENVKITEPTTFEDYIVLNSNTDGANFGPIGTIYYFNGSFYGKTSFGVKQLDNTTSASIKTEEELKTLKEENESLKKELALIQSQLNKIEKMLNKM